jgi:hypothetical protein
MLIITQAGTRVPDSRDAEVIETAARAFVNVYKDGSSTPVRPPAVTPAPAPLPTPTPTPVPSVEPSIPAAVVETVVTDALTTHVRDERAHPTYDDLPSLALLFQNGLV